MIGNLVPLLRGLSGNTQDLFWYLAESMDKENNIRITQKKLSKSMNIAQPHISKVLKELEYHGLILRGYGLYMINPELIYKGNHSKRKSLSAEYERLSAKKKGN